MFDLNNALFLDDYHLIINNDFIHNLSWSNVKHWFADNYMAGAGRLSNYWRPLFLFSLAVNYALDSSRPFGYHLVNNLIHILNGILVFQLMLYILQKRWPAFLTALIFVIHPAQSENVAYTPGRGDLLASLFILLGLIFWKNSFAGKRYSYSVFWACTFFVLALMSRESAVVFPLLAMIVFIFVYWPENKIIPAIKRGLIKTIPFWLITIVYFALRFTVLNFNDFLNFGNLDPGSVYFQRLSVRLYTFSHALLEYFRVLFYPTNVHERFTFPIHRSFFDLPVLVGVMAVAAIMAVAMRLYLKDKSKIQAGFSAISEARIWFFGWGWFFAALLPGSGIIPTNVIMHDHRLYLPLIGVFAVFYYYLDKVLEYAGIKDFKFFRNIVISGLIFYLIFLSGITVKRAIIWGKPIDLFEETLRYEPDAVFAHNTLAAEYINIGNYEKAKNNLLIAMEKGYSSPELYFNLGQVWLSGPEADLERAISYYKKAIESNKNYWPAYRRLAEIYMENGRDLPQAAYYLQKLNELRPYDVNVYYNLALVLYLLGEKSEALKLVERGKVLAGKVSKEPIAQKVFDDLKTKINLINNDEQP